MRTFNPGPSGGGGVRLRAPAGVPPQDLGAFASLNADHSHFLLIDDGGTSRFGWGAELALRAETEAKYAKLVGVPIVQLCVQGGAAAGIQWRPTLLTTPPPHLPGWCLLRLRPPLRFSARPEACRGSGSPPLAAPETRMPHLMGRPAATRSVGRQR